MNLFADAYKVKLPVFEGPLDLLLHLIRKDDISIADIPIARVLEQYLEYLSLMQELNIDLAGEFILMAAELTHLKSKILLPESDEEEEDTLDPRADLARRLLEYQRFKDAAAALSGRPLLGREVFKRPAALEEEDSEEGPLEADVFKLLSAFNDLLKNLKPEKAHEVTVERLSVTERIYELLEKLKSADSVTFDQLFEGQATKPQCIVTFLAILEMARLRLIRVFQVDLSSPLRIQLSDNTQDVGQIQVGSEFDEKEGQILEGEGQDL